VGTTVRRDWLHKVAIDINGFVVAWKKLRAFFLPAMPFAGRGLLQTLDATSVSH
jgi:hypothetical protein